MIARILRQLEKRPLPLYVALAILTLITLALTLLPQEKMVETSLFQYDKLGHAFVFGSWTLLLGLILLVSGQKPPALFSIFLAGSIFGISIEILQEVLPLERGMEPFDALADMVGCLSAVILLKIITSRSSYSRGFTKSQQDFTDRK
ncbi:MAG: hypothetical protein WEC12_07155 [Balneolaceae bacterium]